MARYIGWHGRGASTEMPTGGHARARHYSRHEGAHQRLDGRHSAPHVWPADSMRMQTVTFARRQVRCARPSAGERRLAFHHILGMLVWLLFGTSFASTTEIIILQVLGYRRV